MQVENYFRQDFNERTINYRPENSVEGHIFMKTVTDNVQLKEDHYQIPHSSYNTESKCLTIGSKWNTARRN